MRFSAIALVIIGVSLTGLNVYGLFDKGLSRHNMTLLTVRQKGDMPVMSAEEARRQLDALAEGDENYLTDVNRIFAASIVHYWIEGERYDPDLIYRPQENWIVFLLGHAEGIFFRLGLLDRYRFAELERLDWQDVIDLGVGFCSQASIAVSDYLRQRGYATNVVGLGGHVVLQVTDGEGRRTILDPDFNVVLPGGIKDIQDNFDLVKDTYLKAGYVEHIADEVAGIYGSQGNWVGDSVSYAPRNMGLVFKILFFAKWTLPVIFMAVGLFMCRKKYTGSSSGEVDNRS